MFEIGWSELVLIGIVALIVIGPKELPSVLRTVGRTVTRLRRMAGEFQGQFQEALREADLADMRKEIADVTDSARSSLDSISTKEMFDPLRSIRDEIRSTVEGATGKTAVAGAASVAASAAAAETGAPAGDAASTPAAESAPAAPAADTPAPPEASAADRLEAQIPLLPEREPLPEPIFETPTGPIMIGPDLEADPAAPGKSAP